MNPDDTSEWGDYDDEDIGDYNDDFDEDEVAGPVGSDAPRP